MNLQKYSLLFILTLFGISSVQASTQRAQIIGEGITLSPAQIERQAQVNYAIEQSMKGFRYCYSAAILQKELPSVHLYAYFESFELGRLGNISFDNISPSGENEELQSLKMCLIHVLENVQVATGRMSNVYRLDLNFQTRNQSQ